MNDEQNILKQIEIVNEQIRLLSDKKQTLISDLQRCKTENFPIAKTFLEVDSGNVSQNNLSVPDKIVLFRSLFHGRDDVYARFWVSKKTGKSGYSPVCKNEWVSSVCKKSVIKCSDCPNRELNPLTDDVVYKHLSGNNVIGVYPLLQNENCRFLAIDFDGEGWVDNVFAFKRVCIEEGVPAAVERSRSGNGAHVWIFFNEEVSASSARKLGSFLITKTMENRYQIEMKSYDRLFPNQDTMPKGGFGNLIALPLQKEALKSGNSVFIDDNCNPYKDQWLFLSSVHKMSAYDVENIATKATRDGQVVGVRPSPADEDDPPWMMMPSGKKRYKPNISDLPDEVQVVIANRIYIKTDALPSVLLNQIKRLAAFQNPEFYRKQSMRLSTAITPRIICCAEIIDGYLSLPRGCMEAICCMLNEYGIDINLKDERFNGSKTKFRFTGTLSNKQETILKEVLNSDNGVLVAPPGIGKTVVAINAIAKRKTNTLILVHRKPLMEQWKLQLASYLDISLKDIGEIGAGKNKPNGILDIAMVQSMERKGRVDDRIADYGFVIVDECHHISAVSFERVLNQTKSKYVLGLTATPYRKDGHQPIIHMQCGPISCLVKQAEMRQEKYSYQLIPRLTTFIFEWTDLSKIHELWPNLVNNTERNKIINDIQKTLEEGRFPIIITERREHLALLESMLKDKVDYLAVLHGGVRTKNRKMILEELKNCPDNCKKVILATGSYIGEGFDDPRLDTLFLTMPISFKGKLVQYSGRLHRSHENKKDICIYDYVDNNISVLAGMYKKRLKVYNSLGYKVKEDNV